MPSGGSASLTASSSVTTSLSKGPPPPPETPSQVRDLGVGVCYDLGAFRELMRQYRLLDDGVTTRLNRTIAKSRSSGQTHSPSLLYSPTTFSSSSSSSPNQGSSSSNPLSSSGSSSLGAGTRFSSSSAADLGTTTYVASDEACGAFWKELTGYWKGRQDVIRYCIDVVDKGAGGSGTSTSSSSPKQIGGSSIFGKAGRDDRELDADYQASRPPTSAASRMNEAPSAFPGWDDRGSRAEQSDAALRRQLHNELSIDSIIRNRSLQAFKSRCTLFRLPVDASEEERKFWQGER
ncbi:hypothetical protein BCV69DRAFT_300497 [Microstroma glucosiphilum]|uniref:Uncharacterized protein n=1 Tax=Pseudomicrostroma glucosiphilum TaxID=1684307 RepID=A0A316U463_9BASI|nr:hypothetical protein BCV69DRAFT_300497 [Pseudomicrostroma glucosiphilum]PWN19163.1 hypothetical protein BCV69DRAFT_300497 [Pseudomicrostroma glucosiphilum]